MAVELDTARIDVDGFTLVLGAETGCMPRVLHWGKPLPPGEDAIELAAATRMSIQKGTLDQPIPLTTCPEEGEGFPGQPGIRLSHGTLTRFLPERMWVEGRTIRVIARDKRLDLMLEQRFSLHEGGLLEAESLLTGSGVTVEWLSVPVLPIPETVPELVDHAGRWTREFTPMHVPIGRGVHLRENRRGRTGHDHFPAFLFEDAGSGLNTGEVRSIHFGFSGSHRLLVEGLSDGRRQVQAGIAESRALTKDVKLSSGVAYYGYSDAGLNGLAARHHEHVRTQIVRFPDPDRERPVHYNCWEAVYFRHELDELKDIAVRAADLGAERFVLDDGWFGCRDDDTSSLGDWEVDPRKFPDGLTPLIEHVETLGMRFGLWVEPEMINFDSELARAHPDWIIGQNGLDPIEGRNQQVIDLSNEDAWNHLWEQLDTLLATYRIDYLKWDMNRDLTHAPTIAQQTEAVYRLIDALRLKHPTVEIESCASGGARIDYGILRRTHRVWLSDSNDAQERWRMQHAASLFLPPEIVGSHVGPATCHTSGRRLPMAFRAVTALTGHMGFEMDPREVTDEDAVALKKYVALYKENRGWMHRGQQIRLSSPRDEVMSQAFIAEDASKFLAFSATLGVGPHEAPAPLMITGLAPLARYHVRLLNPEEIFHGTTRTYTGPLLDGVVLSGAALAAVGVTLPAAFPDRCWVLAGEIVEDRV